MKRHLREQMQKHRLWLAWRKFLETPSQIMCIDREGNVRFVDGIIQKHQDISGEGKVIVVDPSLKDTPAQSDVQCKPS